MNHVPNAGQAGNGLLIFQLSKPFERGTSLTIAEHEALNYLQRAVREMVRLFHDRSLRVAERFSFDGHDVLLHLEQDLFVQADADPWRPVYETAVKLCRFALALESVKATETESSSSDSDQKTCDGAQSVLNELERSKTACGQSFADQARAWLRSCSRITRTCIQLSFPRREALEMVIPPKQRLFNSREVRSPKPQAPREGALPKVAGPAALIRSMTGDCFVLHGPRPALQVGDPFWVDSKTKERAPRARLYVSDDENE